MWKLVIKEMLFRSLNTLLQLLSVATATVLFTAAITFLKTYETQTNVLLDARRADVDRQMAVMKDDYRKITKNLGFNILILPKEQNLSDLYAQDYAIKTMPESYAQRLADSKIMSVRHLLPVLQRKIVWPEKRRTIILMGVKGEVPLLHRRPRSPILQPVEKGMIVIGHELCASFNIAAGDTVVLRGKKFRVATCYEKRGNKDDITAWIALAEAQQMLDMRDSINAIFALECRCVADSTLANIAKIRSDLMRILPETQAIEFMSKAVTRAEARHRAAMTAKSAIAVEERSRNETMAHYQRIASVLLPLVFAVCFSLICILTYANFHKRANEIALMKSIGIRSRKVFLLFIAKAAVLGFAGSISGYAISSIGTFFYLRATSSELNIANSFDSIQFVLTIIITAILMICASWIPALHATLRQPAGILQEE